MGFLLLLPLLVSGFLVCLKHRGIYYRLHRYEGQLLYLQVARYGMNCLFVSFAIVGLVSFVFSHNWSASACLREYCVGPVSWDFLHGLGEKMKAIGFAKDEARGEVAAFLLLVGVGAMALPVPWTAWLMRRFKKKLRHRLKRQQEGGEQKFDQRPEEIASAYLLKESVAHSPRLKMLYEAFATQQPVMLSMSDRKVYVGNILSLGAHTEVAGIDQEIHLAPIVSGYRNDDTLALTYTTDYAGLAVACSVYLKQENIVSVTPYSGEVRTKFEDVAKKSATDAVAVPNAEAPNQPLK